ncbi:LexA family transcriptional regulator [uncultured Tyzzerella sp.]|uniref:helix-turn-helix domain-containing protein n=1 Tax=uncultured Tyzzerella sp. TaxID=2321398 RepID=UPI0029429A94|nr:LexA family transcriptional regulator [uncultured Tyzzerella sp.]
MNKRLKELRKNILNLTLKDFGNEISLSPGALGDIENGRRILQNRHIKLICQTFNVNEDWLRNGVEPVFIESKENNKTVTDVLKENGVKPMVLEIVENYLKMTDENKNIFDGYLKALVGLDKYNEAAKKVKENKELLEELSITTDSNIINIEEVKEIKLYDTPVSAGKGYFISDYEDYEIVNVDLKLVPQARRCDFALRVRGDSMEPNYYDGDIVFIKEQPSLDNGQIGIFIYDGEAYIKKYSIQDNGIYLVSLNKKYNPIKLDENSCIKICGLVL